MSKELTCKLYTDPETAQQVKMDMFDVVQTYADDDHFRKLLLKCKECGQLYFYEMRESIDWVGGKDPIFRTYTPVNSEKDVKEGNFKGLPRLQYDWAADLEKPKIWWNEGK